MDEEGESGNDPPPHPALMNHVVLNTIAQYLPVRARIRARSVCKLWHQVFSSSFTLTFNTDRDYMLYFLFNNNSTVSEILQRNLHNYFTRFNLSNSDLGQRESLEIIMLFNQLTNNTNIREISLPILPIKVIPPILALMSKSIEILEIKLPRTDIEEQTTLKLSIKSNDEDDVFLKEVKVLKISAYKDSTEDLDTDTSAEELVDHLAYFFNLLNVTSDSVRELDVSETKVDLDSLIDWIIVNKPRNLRKLKLHTIGFTELILLKILNLTSVLTLEEIRLGGTILTKETFSDFIHILAVHSPGKFQKLAEKKKKFEDKKMENVSTLQVAGLVKNVGLSLDKIFFHFPKLEELNWDQVLFQDNPLPIVLEDEEAENLPVSVYPTVKRLTYKMITPGQVGHDHHQGLRPDAFPNLTQLSLKVPFDCPINVLNIGIIFSTLKKLEKLQIIYFKGRNINDHMITGISKKTLQRHLRDLPYEFLSTMKEDEFPKCKSCSKKQEPIVGLKELKELDFRQVSRMRFGFEIPELNDHDEDDGGFGGKLMTEISIFFGFRLLPKLEKLSLQVAAMEKIRQEHWNIMIDDFPQLETLKLPAACNAEIFRKVRAARPLLHIEFA